MQKSGIVLFSLTVILSIILTGCFQGEQSLEEIDSPREATAVDSLEEGSLNDDEDVIAGEDEVEELISVTVARQLYLVDVNGMLAAQTLELPKLDSNEVATQVLTYLVKDGPVTPILPNGFQAVLPEGTEVLGLNLQEDGTLIVDVSKEFENYEAKDELRILQSMTYTLTQFENVDRIQLRINGYPQDEMPVNGTPMVDGYSRVNGINLVETDVIDLLDSRAVTIYYPSEYNDNRYYVPVTQHVNTDDEEVFSSIVRALIDGPGYNVNITHVFNAQTSLINSPTLKNGVLELMFNQEILQDIDKAMISDEVMETLVRTLTEQYMVDSVEVKVENIDQLTNENGEFYSEPVTKETFMKVEKL